MDALYDPWQLSKATLGMMRGMGLQQQPQGGIPINGQLGGGQPGQLMRAQAEPSPVADLAHSLGGIGGALSGPMVQDALKKRKAGMGGTPDVPSEWITSPERLAATSDANSRAYAALWGG